ncbi:MAG: YggS family pyridoxal phosphate-dependent enzyme [Deltaproteobacteria bacterium]|nr:MAG: YggS family pyridoxal phosphate-dependent enzyme [Deltaproteobacteria bacterium]
MGVAENLARVQERIRAACSRAGRDRDTVQLVAVSKGQPIEAVLLAFAAGQTVFGENYAQELHEKADALPEAEWHFIGALQTNKVKIVVGHSALVHTCDRASLANELSKRAEMKNIVQRVLLEVNVGREPQKGGALPEQVDALHAAVREMERLRCDGLMCIPPPEQDPRPHFRALREMRDRLGLRELSMGMTADFEAAIEEGATIVRIGTAIFGERPRR